MYCDLRQWRHIRRRILEQGTPKKRVSAETGISRKTINKMLAHEQPPGYRRAHDDESAWARAYDLIIHLPKPRALDLIRHLSRGHPPAYASAQLRSFIREAACPRMPPARSGREGQRLLHIEWMRRVLQKESNEDALHHELGDIPDLSILLQHLHNGRLSDRNRAMVGLESV